MKKARDLDVEILPPEKAPAAQPIVGFLAHLMDDAFRLPGTNLRFGLDPLIGLLPGLGDTLAGLMSAFLIAHSARLGVPKIILARMALNVLINSIGGAIPIAGDAFSFWFKSNIRNYELLQKHAAAPRASTVGDWLFVIALLVALIGAMVAVIAVIAFLFGKIFAAAQSTR